jgi:hypothetical protein
MTHPGEVASYLAGVRHALEPSYDVERKEFAGQVVLVGHRSDFRLRWFASRLHTTVTVAAFDAGVDAAQLDEYLAAAGRAARDAGGRVPRGLQSGTAAVAVAVLPTLSADARDWALHPHGHRFASVGYPVAVGI